MQISNPGKLLFPDDGITKADLADYYQRMADAMLPWLRDRPTAMIRYPDGLRGAGIMQKNVPRNFPDWIRTADVPKEGGTVRQLVCDRPDTLSYLAGQACIEIHAFLSRLGRLRQPDQLIFDLDPPDGAPFNDVVIVATELRGRVADRAWTAELDDQALQPARFTIGTVPGRGGDPWAPMRRRRFGLGRARQVIGRIAA